MPKNRSKFFAETIANREEYEKVIAEHLQWILNYLNKPTEERQANYEIEFHFSAAKEKFAALNNLAKPNEHEPIEVHIFGERDREEKIKKSLKAVIYYFNMPISHRPSISDLEVHMSIAESLLELDRDYRPWHSN